MSMIVRKASWLASPIHWFSRATNGATNPNRRLRSHRRTRPQPLSCESLEDRVVLSGWGGNSLTSALSYAGVVTSAVQVGERALGGWGEDGSQSTQLQTDIQTLRTELASLAAKSGLTVADASNLAADSQAISAAGFTINASNLKTVVSELASAVAGGTSTAQAQTDFNNLFSGSSVSQTVITKAFNDMVQAITDSKVTTADLQTVAADEAAIQNDQSSSGEYDGDGRGFGAAGGGDRGSLTAALNHVGVVTQAVTTTDGCGDGGSDSQSTSSSQLQTDIQTLRTELASLAAKSGLTVADQSNLSSDSQAIAAAGFSLNGTNLKAVVSELAGAVAGGTSTTQAQTDFNNLFSGSSVSQAVITKTFNDLVQAITDSKVTTTDLQAVAADEAAIKSDLASQQSSTGSDAGSDGGSCSGSSTSSSNSSSNSSSSSSSSSSTAAVSSSTVVSADTTSSATSSTTTRAHHHASSAHHVRALTHHRRH
jgi:hypothetical protein